MDTVRVAETFTSLQGESRYAGWPCFFVRLAGCNLHCRYCDTPEARAGGVERPVAALVDAWRRSRAALAEITGGEPLLQDGFPALAEGLRDASDRPVLVETNGSLDLTRVPEGVTAVVDVKCPGSGEAGSFDPANLARLRPYDEVKFVLSGREDYEWASACVARHGLAGRVAAVHFGPVHGALDAAALARWILDDGLNVRLQVQLHRWMGLR
ncbi:MAG: radical SAM protein [Lentisphaerae bacterium]|nr:radical SAM protein [Lentisphaerota bacterium]